jgi:SAM-dependent methyltransferase
MADWQDRQEASVSRYASDAYDAWEIPARMFGQFIAATLTDRTGVVLDIGCGIKPTLPPVVSELGLTRYIGLEPLDVPVEREYQCLIASAESIPLEDASIDAVICSSSLDHIPDEDAAISEIKRVLKPGSPIYVWHGIYDPDTLIRTTTFESAFRHGPLLAPPLAAAHAALTIRRVAKRKRSLERGRRIDPYHERWYTRDGLRNAFTRWGFDIVRELEPPGFSSMFFEARASDRSRL